ncbi:MAG TPA: imidazole glycerol phosphate synthase subunit HisF [bacterium]|nr:imidazole glycerol phosphate synthase subunit HisF [bacterium]
MKNIRIIPCLDVDNGRVVKGTKFENIRDAGNPVELAQKYYNDGADELTFLDIGATYKSRDILIQTVEQVSRKVFIPLTVGRGIKSVEEMKTVLRHGADKVSICSSALLEPELISRAAEIFGSQCIVVSIDAKKCGESWNAFRSGGRIDTGIDAVSFALESQKRGAGEILLNSIDNDGMQDGYDIELLKAVSLKVSIPVIASGGAGKLDDFAEGVTRGNADALLLASLLHDGIMTIAEIKNYLKNMGVNVRC